ncbi:MAG: winged helix-turn-helix domain-containing protein [Anaerolineae bacterium]|nr:winged helix-turn-helix domain-containing protein [Anaerolineae bacterium]
MSTQESVIKSGETLLIVGAGETGNLVARHITERGYHVEATTSPRDAVSRVSNGEAGVILLDLTAGQTSLDLADTLMGLPSCPPIVVLDKDPTVERVVAALRIGVVDYLSIGDGESEIVDRLTTHLAKAQAAARAAQLRREAAPRARESSNGATSGLTGLELNAARRMLIIEDVPILLSSIELNLVELLIRRAPSLVTYEEMAQVAFPTTTDVEHALRLLRPHIARLRRKFESVHNTRWRIANFRGQGYVLQRIGAPVSINVPKRIQPARGERVVE